ncbi:MAG: hypothetical protein U1C74_17380 [Phenylobacterium sp.]|nr:hypothetical protein [Phenylobacterium sp.]
MTRRTVCVAYVVACGAALATAALGSAGWLQVEARRAADLVVIVLGLPWSLLARQVPGAGPVGHLVMGAAAMALNLAIVSTAARGLARRR